MDHTDKPDAEAILANPIYVVKIAGPYFSPHEPIAAKEDWVLMNSKLIESMGSKGWLSELLETLASADEESFAATCNPYHAIELLPSLYGLAPLVDRDTWIDANTRLISEIGSGEWLDRLLVALETGMPQA